MFTDEKQIHFGEINKHRQTEYLQSHSDKKIERRNCTQQQTYKDRYVLKHKHKVITLRQMEWETFTNLWIWSKESINAMTSLSLTEEHVPSFHILPSGSALRKPPAFSGNYAVLLGSVVSALITWVDTVICNNVNTITSQHNYSENIHKRLNYGIIRGCHSPSYLRSFASKNM